MVPVLMVMAAVALSPAVVLLLLPSRMSPLIMNGMTVTATVMMAALLAYGIPVGMVASQQHSVLGLAYTLTHTHTLHTTHARSGHTQTLHTRRPPQGT